jgi:hypothetical protein
MVEIIDPNQWRDNSMKGLGCAVILCHNKPTKPCSRCLILIHYCYEHMKSHSHIVSS